MLSLSSKTTLALTLLLSAQAIAHADECESIRDGIRLLPPAGGTFFIPPGNYTCNAPIVLDRDNISLSGRAGVRLRLADNANAPLIVIGSTLTPPPFVQNIAVTDIVLDGNTENQQMECWGGPCDSGGNTYIRNNGVTIRGAVNSTVRDVTVRGARSGGLVAELGTRGLLVDGLKSSENFFDGMAACQTYESTFSHLELFDNQAAGISTDIDFSGNVIRHAHVHGNRDVGIFMRHSNGILYESVRVDNSRSHGIFIASSHWFDSCANGNEFRDLTVSGSGGFGIVLADPCLGNRLTGNPQFRDNSLGCLGLGQNSEFGVPPGFECTNGQWP